MKTSRTLVRLVPGLCLVIAAGCSVIGPTPSPGPTLLALRTQPSPGPNEICAQALGGGRLVVDPVSGLGIADTFGHVIHVYWPFGFTARPDGGRIALVDGQGRIVAHVGDVIGMIGGYGADDGWYACEFGSITLQATSSP